jgi:cell wall assembly regulator SMI1
VAGVAACSRPETSVRATSPPRRSLSATIVLETPSMHTARPATAGPSAPTPAHRRVAACHPSGKPVPVAAPPAQMAARVARAWRRIQAWLVRYAPRSARSLPGPASSSAIARAQRRLGRPLPPDLVASLRTHDGVREGRGAFTFPPFYAPLSAAQIPAEWRVMCGVLESGGPAPPGDWLPPYTPFATANDGGLLYTDQRQGHGDHIGEYFAEEGASTAGWPGSYAALLEWTASLLETGRRGPSGFHAAAHQGALEWKP